MSPYSPYLNLQKVNAKIKHRFNKCMTITELILQSLSFFLYMICNTPPPPKKISRSLMICYFLCTCTFKHINNSAMHYVAYTNDYKYNVYTCNRNSQGGWSQIPWSLKICYHGFFCTGISFNSFMNSYVNDSSAFKR